MKKMPSARIVATAVVLLASAGAFAQTPQYTCTQVLGYSQTAQWYLGGDQNGATAAFELAVSDDHWQVQACGGAGVQRWADPEFSCWTSQIRSPCANGTDTPERFLISISDGGLPDDDVQRWADAIQGTIDALRINHPQVQSIILQPVVGVPNDGPCWRDGDGPPAQQVRATRNHPTIDQAIAQLVGGDVIAGMSPEVRECTDYTDGVGHFIFEAEAAIGAIIGQFYAEFDGGPPPTDPPPNPENLRVLE
jgi:hypothetical protein